MQTTTTSSTTTTAAQTPAKSTAWTIDTAHTHASFSVRHLMISSVRGEFQKVTGEATFDPANPQAASVKASIDIASISTRDAQRDAHLRSADFFDVETRPTRSRATPRS